MRSWEKYAIPLISSAGDKALTGAALINVSTDRPSRFSSPIVEQEGLNLRAADMRYLVEAVRNNCLHCDYFYIGAEKYIVTTVLENLYAARCMNCPDEDEVGGGALIARHASAIILATYQGGICEASEAAEAVNTLVEKLV